MQKKTKNVFTAVLTVLFVLSVSYFALVAPTTAWYYQEENDSYSFEFGDFDVEQENREEITTAIPLRAATRFADYGELLFDEVVHVVKVDAENTGGMTAQLRVTVTEGENNPEGLKWFVYDTTRENEIQGISGGTGAVKGSYKTAVEEMLLQHSITPIDYSTIVSADAESEYETYNATAVTALDNHNGQKIVFEPTEKRVVYVVFWAEYGEIKDTLNSTTPVTIGDYEVNIDFEASPYVPEYVDLVIYNKYTSTVNVMLFTNGSSERYSGMYYYNTGSNLQEMNASGGLIGAINEKEIMVRLEVGTPFKLVIASSGLPVKFSTDENEGTITGVTNMVATGSATNYGNYIKIVPATDGTTEAN